MAKRIQDIKRQRLPIDDVLGALEAALAGQSRAVLVAPPGAGKTTIVPLALRDADWVTGQRILVVEPRRLAARAAAARMADLLGEAVGETVGVRARLASQVGPKTRIEVITEGVFTRMIIDDPALDGVAAVLFDEFHERSLDGDFGLALAIDAQAGLRDDLRIVVMSATIDGAGVAAILGDAPLIESAGRAFAVETRYLGRDRGVRIEQAVGDAILAALREEAGSVLAFLPGQAEIRRTVAVLEDRLDDAAVIVAPLYGAMDLAAQSQAIRPAPAGQRKVVLATAIAETSLTIDGVRIVVDAGLARVPRFDPGVRVTRLETVRVSRAGADQRRGRAGRTEPGVCYRLWHEAETKGLRPFEAPEILSADLSGLMLDCASWGVTDPARLVWLAPPPAGGIAAAREALIGLGAIAADGQISGRGRAMRQLAMAPHLATMVLEAAESGQAKDAAELAALLVERGVGGRSIDLDERLGGFRSDHSQRARQLRALAARWAQTAEKLSGQRDARRGQLSTAALLASAFPDRIARRQGAGGRYLMASGRAARLADDAHPGDAEFLVVAELQGAAAAARILAAARLTAQELENIAGARITDSEELTFDRAAAAVRARRVRRLDAIVLSRDALATPRDARTAQALARGLADDIGVARLPWSKALSQLRARVAFLRSADPVWPDLGDAALAAKAEDWLAPFLAGKTALADVTANDLNAAIDALLPWELRRRLEEAAPTHFTAPSGQRHAIDYAGENAPGVALRVQELYGLDRHPAIAGGRLALTLTLLSPAGRPIQVTRDLPGFWAGSWRDVKAEMKGRYPKHVWPDDPASAKATTRAKPRGR